MYVENLQLHFPFFSKSVSPNYRIHKLYLLNGFQGFVVVARVFGMVSKWLAQTKDPNAKSL